MDFMSELTRKELEKLRYHFGTSSWGGTRYMPLAFTEEGVAMLSGLRLSAWFCGKKKEPFEVKEKRAGYGKGAKRKKG